MTLQWVDIEVPFTQGINGKQNPKVSEGPLVLENANFDESGSINKRNTYSSTASTGARSIISRDTFAVQYLTSATRMPTLKAYNSIRSTISFLANHLNCKVEVDKAVLGVPSAYVGMRTLDCICGVDGSNLVYYAQQGYIAAASFDSTRLVTKNTLTGQTLETVTVVGDYTSGRFVKIGTWGYIWAFRKYVGAIQEIAYVKKPTATAYWSDTAIPMTTGTLETSWDICCWKDNYVVVAWLDAAHHVNLTTWNLATGAENSTVDTGVEAAFDSCLAVYSDQSATIPVTTVMYEAGATHQVSFMVYDKDLSQTVAPVTLLALGAGVYMMQCSIASKPDNGPSTLSYVLSYDDGTTYYGHTVIGEINTTTGAPVSSQSTLWFTRLASKQVTIGYETYFWVLAETNYSGGYGTNLQPGAYLITRSLGHGGSRQIYTVASALYGDAHELTIDALDRGKLPGLSVETLSSAMVCYRLYWVNPVSTDSSSSSQKVAAAVSVVMNPFIQDVLIDHSHLLTGGMVYALGNSTCHENGWLQYPVISDLSQNASGGSMSNGTYSVVVVAEYVDESGQLHRSAPSLPVVITLTGGGAGQRIIVTVKTMVIGDPTKLANCKYAIYRTINGGTTYYNTKEYATPNLASATAGAVSLTSADATVDDYPVLYTTGQVLESIAPPPPVGIAKSSDRVFVLSGDDRSEVWFSKPKEEGIAVEFNDSCVIRFPEPLDCIKYCSGALYGFGKGLFYAVSGEGPNALNSGGQFSLPQLISSVTGCQNPHSLVETPQGLMFQSQMPMDPIPSLSPSATASSSAGLWLLSGGALQPVLAPDDYRFYPVSSAINVPKKNQILLTLWGYTGKNAILAYDYISGQWSTHLVTEAGATYPIGALVNGVHQFVSGAYWYQQAATFAAADAMKIRTPWMKPGGMVAGYGRVRWIYLTGTYKSAHTLNINVYYDYDDSTVVETKTKVISASQVPYLYRFKPARQRCNAVMLEIYDSSQAGTYESVSLDGCMLSVGKKPKQVMSAARTI